MRLDSFLVSSGDLGSRGRAKRAITEGHVKVNGRVIFKPSYDVAYSDNIEMNEDLDKPAGYWKLKNIQVKTKFMKKGDIVLDVGSSAGGFLMLASEIAAHVHGIEFSHEFHSVLQKVEQDYKNVTVEFGDIFSLPQSTRKYDVLLLDITVSPLSSIKALEILLPALKSGGKLLHVLKLSKATEIRPLLPEISSLGLDILNIMEPEKK